MNMILLFISLFSFSFLFSCVSIQLFIFFRKNKLEHFYPGGNIDMFFSNLFFDEYVFSTY